MRYHNHGLFARELVIDMKSWSIWLICCSVGSGVGLAQSPKDGDLPAPAPIAVRVTPQSAQASVVKIKASVTQFHRLLAMNPEDREKVLANKSDKQRKYLRNELKKYDDMTPETRGTELQALRVRYYLKELVKWPAESRQSALAVIPDADRKLVEDRLQRWDRLSPDLQKEVLDNERTIRYVLQLEGLSREEQQQILPTLPKSIKETWERKLEQWHSLPSDHRQRIYAQFHRFFELSPKERAKVLETLSESERQQAKESLDALEKLPPDERNACVETFYRVVEKPPKSEDHIFFLESVQRWKAMTPKEKQVWKDLMIVLPPIPGTTTRLPPRGENKPAPPPLGIPAERIKQ